MNPREVRSLLVSRAAAAGLTMDDVLLGGLETYLRLLARWNARINLTGFSLDKPTAHAVDRLLIEPMLITRALPYPIHVWFDLGSGGGSPAIPIQLYKPAALLVLVESKGRKAAFLREVSRELGLSQVEVEAARIESIAATHRHAATADLVTIRAVRPSDTVFVAVRGLLRTGGQAAILGSPSAPATPIGFQVVQTVEFDPGSSLRLFAKL
jgi:16S rRNA (guanine527-N7)-methyltransferase